MKSVQEFLKADRQWRREHRIAHAKSMLGRANTRDEKQFWRDVLEANVGD